MKKVMAFGTFDVIHPGHIYFLNQAKKLGDTLVVLISRDKTIESVKGNPPHFNEGERMKHLEKTLIPDKVILGTEPPSLENLKKEKPDIIALGYDQKFMTDKLKELKIETKRIDAFKEHIYKSSILKGSNA
ncbi:adenylyltransferase/cytidyltransferase family protein [Nanoarchaeota archaeon]